MKKQKLSRKKHLFIPVVVAILLFAGIGVYAYYNFIPVATNKKSDIVKPKTAAEQTDEIVANSDNEDAADNAEKLQRMADATDDKSKKASYLSGKALVYINSGEKAKALSAAKEFESVDSSALSAGMLGDVYYAQDDYKNAAKFYEIAASRSKKPSSPTERVPYNDYKLLQKQAEAKL